MISSYNETSLKIPEEIMKKVTHTHTRMDKAKPENHYYIIEVSHKQTNTFTYTHMPI